MAKGSGGGGHGGGGGKNAVAGGAGGAPSVEIQRAISEGGGVSNMAEIPFRKEFESGGARQRSLDYYTGQLANAKTTTEKNAITKSWKPIEIGVAKQNGKWVAGLEDGRHRLYSARKMGATKIPANVTYKAKSGEYRTIKVTVKV